MKAKDPSELDRLRTRIKDALARDRPSTEILPMLQALLDGAGEQRDLRVFAHRHLAELTLQDQPWQAALHLRRVIKANAADDTVHALMGLCQALLGNFDSAVHHYERALSIEPANAWYHHNLGHLLDVALDMPDAALVHLRSRLRRRSPIASPVSGAFANPRTLPAKRWISRHFTKAMHRSWRGSAGVRQAVISSALRSRSAGREPRHGGRRTTRPSRPSIPTS